VCGGGGGGGGGGMDLIRYVQLLNKRTKGLLFFLACRSKSVLLYLVCHQ